MHLLRLPLLRLSVSLGSPSSVFLLSLAYRSIVQDSKSVFRLSHFQV